MKIITLTLLLALAGLSTAQAETTYWLPTQSMTDSGRMYAYETKAPDYVASWLKKETSIGGGSIVTRTIKGQQYRFIKQTFTMLKPFNGAVNIETHLTNGFGGGKWEHSADLKNQTGVIAALRSNVIQSIATHEKSQILALIHEGDTPPGLTFTDTMVPFDASSEGRLYEAQGSRPEIVAFPRGNNEVDVAWQDYAVDYKTSGSAKRTIYVHRLTKRFPESSSAELVAKIPFGGDAGPRSLGLLAGFTEDNLGNIYLLTAADEKVTRNDTSYVHRKNILNLIKLDSAGNFQWQTDLNVEGKVLQPIYTPMEGGSARLVFGTVKGVDLIFVDYMGSDGKYDFQLANGGGRHQHSDWCLVDAKTGEVPKVEGLSATNGRGSHGHSFDLRVIFDPTSEQFVATEVSDASFSVTIDQPLQSGHQYTKDGVTAVVVNNKRGQPQGDNNHFMELGGVANVGSGYLVLAARQSAGNVPYDLFAKQMPRNFWEKYFKDDSSWNQEKEGPPTQLTKESGDGSGGAVRPKLIQVADDEFIVLFERWQKGGYESTQAMKIGADGSVRMAAKKLDGNPRLPRGDDGFTYVSGLTDRKACAAWVTGAPGELVVHAVRPDGLDYVPFRFYLDGEARVNTEDNGTPAPSKDLVDQLPGMYNRQPMLNEYHNVSILKNDQGKLVWTNGAGVSWPLETSGTDLVCDTGKDAGKVRFKVSVGSDGQVTSLTANDESYVRLSLEKVKTDLVGRYERDPVLNNHHRVSITKSDQNDLTWTNDAGTVWKMNVRDGVIWLDTGKENIGEVRVRLRLSNAGEVTGIGLGTEPYVRK